MFAAALISFRSPQLADMPLIAEWRHAEHVRRWWDEPSSAAELVKQMTTPLDNQRGPQPYVICYDGEPLGFIQAYRIAAWPEYHVSTQVGDNAAGVDMFIGEVAYLHRGLGTAILQRFLAEIVFQWEDISSCIIGPDPTNGAAIKAYEKAGFRHLKTVTIAFLGEQQYLMSLERSALIPHST